MLCCTMRRALQSHPRYMCDVYSIHTVYFIHILHTCTINNHFKVYWLVYIIHVCTCAYVLMYLHDAEHDEVCNGGVARMAIKTGDIRR